MNRYVAGMFINCPPPNYYLGLPEYGESVMSSLSARKFFNLNGLKTRMELAFDYNLQIGIEGYANLAACLNHYVRRLKPNERNNGKKGGKNSNLELRRPR
jgi:hypothetical protein